MGATSTWLAKVVPSEATESVSKESYLGSVAEITVGTTKRGQPAKATLTDDFGYSHNILVEPVKDDAVYHKGDKVVIFEEISSKNKYLVEKLEGDS